MRGDRIGSGKARAEIRRGRTAVRPALGRPRDTRIEAEVTAAVQTLREGGYQAVTIEGIALRLGRARSSLYRRWPSKRHLVVHALVTELGVSPAADTGSLRKDLEAAVGTLLYAFTGPLNGALAGLVADMTQDKELAATIRRKVLVPRRQSMRDALVRAQMRGEVRESLDIELVLDMLTAPFYFRTLFGHAPITRPMIRQVVEYVLLVIQPYAGPTN